MPHGLYFLFVSGTRPARGAMLAAVDEMEFASVTHDPASSPVEPNDPALGRGGYSGQWLELMTSGLTFDLLGMAPGPGVADPPTVHRLALEEQPLFDEMEAMVLMPGPHLADAANSLPIVRAMLDLGCRIADTLGNVAAMCWSPARAATQTALFCRGIRGWTAGGPFPAVGLTAFAVGENGLLRSEGMAFFVGQELQFQYQIAEDRLAATRLGMRLVHDIVGTGRVDAMREFFSDDGRRYLLTPTPDARTVEVTLI